MPDWTHNPLGVTHPYPGSRVLNRAGVRAYPTAAAGAWATAETLRDPRWARIVYEWQRRGSLADIYRAVNGSGWCRGCQDGHFPVRLYEMIAGTLKPTTRPSRPAPVGVTGRSQVPRDLDYSAKVRQSGATLRRTGIALGQTATAVRRLGQ